MLFFSWLAECSPRPAQFSLSPCFVRVFLCVSVAVQRVSDISKPSPCAPRIRPNDLAKSRLALCHHDLHLPPTVTGRRTGGRAEHSTDACGDSKCRFARSATKKHKGEGGLHTLSAHREIHNVSPPPQMGQTRLLVNTFLFI